MNIFCYSVNRHSDGMQKKPKMPISAPKRFPLPNPD